MDLKIQLQRLAIDLAKTAGERQRKRLLNDRMPRLARHMRRMRNENAVLRRWGQSVNVDENVGCQIVSPVVLDLVGQYAGQRMDEPAYHSGLQHTYGYLLSTIQTPYGYKRDRWLSPTIEQGFGLPAKSLHAFPNRGTLLTNLTQFLSELSLRTQSPPAISGAVTSFRRCKLTEIQGWRISEKTRLVEIFTDIFPFRNLGVGESNSLLVYTIRRGRGPAKIYTTFPIDEQTQNRLVAKRQSKNVRIRLRYNSFVAGFPSEGLVGSRKCFELRPGSRENVT